LPACLVACSHGPSQSQGARLHTVQECQAGRCNKLPANSIQPGSTNKSNLLGAQTGTPLLADAPVPAPITTTPKYASAQQPAKALHALGCTSRPGVASQQLPPEPARAPRMLLLPYRARAALPANSCMHPPRCTAAEPGCVKTNRTVTSRRPQTEAATVAQQLAGMGQKQTKGCMCPKLTAFCCCHPSTYCHLIASHHPSMPS
jgi:hypothetical protein